MWPRNDSAMTKYIDRPLNLFSATEVLKAN